MVGLKRKGSGWLRNFFGKYDSLYFNRAHTYTPLLPRVLPQSSQGTN